VAAGAAALVGGLVARLMHNRSHQEEMDVEVGLEERGTRGGFTSSPQPISAEREYEVELEERGAQGRTSEREYDAGLARPGGDPADPPRM
jgi:hypothetical protein